MYGNHWINIEKLKNWSISIEKVVGGFMWLGFSKEEPELMLCISYEKSTIFNCSNGTIIDTDCVFDEDYLYAICDDLKDKQISIAGQYGGTLLKSTSKGDKVISEYENVFEYGKDLVKERVTLCSKKRQKHELYYGYEPYIYGFSYDGNYFVFAHDGGITVLKRELR